MTGYVHIDTSMSTSPEYRFRFTARTSFTRTSERSWSLVCHLYKDNSTRVYWQFPVTSF